MGTLTGQMGATGRRGTGKVEAAATNCLKCLEFQSTGFTQGKSSCKNRLGGNGGRGQRRLGTQPATLRQPEIFQGFQKPVSFPDVH